MQPATNLDLRTSRGPYNDKVFSVKSAILCLSHLELAIQYWVKYNGPTEMQSWPRMLFGLAIDQTRRKLYFEAAGGGCVALRASVR